jgi:hypothetical protein
MIHCDRFFKDWKKRNNVSTGSNVQSQYFQADEMISSKYLSYILKSILRKSTKPELFQSPLLAPTSPLLYS